MSFVQVQITADQVIDAMNEDAGFALEMWREIANGLHKGLLLGNACHMLRSIQIDECVFITQQIKMLPDFLADHINYETNKET